ncbi:MAG: methyltransferase [Rhodospirillales bacterium]|nr:methyltransferase [Rhodospirillales bacterium]
MTHERIIELTILVLALAAVASVLGWYLLTGIPPLPTSPAVKRAMLAALPDKLEGAVYDLGSGWGGMAFALARRYPGCRVTGFEVSPLPWVFSRLRLLLQPTPNLYFRFGNFHKVSQEDAVLVVCYLAPRAMEKLKLKLEAELTPDTLVLCNFFRVPDWRPASELMVSDMHRTPVYLYRIGDQNNTNGHSTG